MADHSPDATKKVDPADVVRLLNVVGDVGTCKGCGATIWWVKTKAGKSAPYTEKALNHFADCPKADRFRKPETKTE